MSVTIETKDVGEVKDVYKKEVSYIQQPDDGRYIKSNMGLD